MKLQKVNQIRRKLRLTTTNKAYFNKTEIKKIVQAINPTFDFDSVPYSEVLSTSISDWKEQLTVQSHPNIENLNVILENVTPYNLQNLLTMIDQELLEQTKTVTLENKILVIQLK